MKALLLSFCLVAASFAEGAVIVLNWIAPVVGGVTPVDPQTTARNNYNAHPIGSADNASVTTFPDTAAGTPNSYTSGSSTYKTSIQNGKNIVRLNGTSHGWFVGGAESGVYPYTAIMVLKVNDLSAAQTILGVGSSTGGFQVQIAATTGNVNLAKAGVSSIASSSSGITAGVFQIVTVRISSSAYDIRINQASAGSGSHAVTLTSSRQFSLGYNRAGGVITERMAGDIAQVCIWASYLSDADVLSYEAYLASYWGL